MTEPAATLDAVWWITAVEVPVLTGLFWLIWRNRRDQEDDIQRHRQTIDKALAQAREALSAYKLEVAKTYASISALKDVERRLTAHLLRIESKLDNTRSQEKGVKAVSKLDKDLPPLACPAADDGPAVDTLARTLWGEARGEPVRGREAVAAVVMNRVAKAEARGGHWWGSTVVEVCRAPWQFSCWNETDPNREKLLAVGEDDPIFPSCLRIARRAIRGALKDPTDGATHYHHEALLPWWAKGRAPVKKIGRHVFYRNIG